MQLSNPLSIGAATLRCHGHMRRRVPMPLDFNAGGGHSTIRCRQLLPSRLLKRNEGDIRRTDSFPCRGEKASSLTVGDLMWWTAPLPASQCAKVWLSKVT